MVWHLVSSILGVMFLKLLSLLFIVLQFLICVDGCLLNALPTVVFLKLGTFGVLEKFFSRDEPIMIGVNFFVNVLSHSVVLLDHLVLVVTGVLFIVQLFYFNGENRLNFFLIKETISIDVVHLKEHFRVKFLFWHVVLLFPDLLQLVLRARVVDVIVFLMFLLDLLVFLFRLNSLVRGQILE